MATLKDISRLTGVSATTISRVLNRDETMLVSRETTRAIFQAAFALGYLTPRQRRAQRHSVVIGIADWRLAVKNAPSITIPAIRHFAEREYPSRSFAFPQIGKDAAETMDAVIAVGDFSAEETEGLARLTPNLVFVNSARRNLLYDHVQVNLTSAMEQAVSYVTEQRKCRSIGYIGGIFREDGCTVGLRRTRRISSLLQRRGLFNPALVRIGGFSAEDGYAMARELLAEREPPDALVIGSDLLAAGVLRLLDEERAVPERLELVVYRDIQIAEIPQGGYAVVEAYPDLLWQKAVQMTMERIGGRREAVSTIISPRLSL